MPKNSGKQLKPNPNPNPSLRERLDGNELDLSLSGLSEVPTRELAALPKATILDLSCNCIVMLPPEFCSLIHLIKLDLSKNKLQELPSDFGRLHNLQHLDLYNNKLTNLPVSFAQLKNLKWLDLKGNPLDPLLEKVAGDCLDEKQCKQSAANVLRYMKTIQSEQDREKQRRLQVERELEKRREAELKAKEARERELRKREKMEEKERRRKEYDAQKLQRFNEPKEEKPTGMLEKPVSSAGPSASQKGHLFHQVLLKVLLFLLLCTVITVVMCRRTELPPEQLCSAVNHLYEDTLHALRGNEVLQRILRSIPFP
ncbi:leucine-rich repeat-containing protein 59 isoform X1 [Carcharodon carcharias]|uniref:leucine-rich repeat-containing protein 59 isoform X1 n=1 Tax=Carcharodon carcharias TaxID=13397 RepID=UPI001B7F31C7|nr:leucine-rich repeat-containing protein 59 isoform X1 [Carcharodon carcharias]